MIDIQEGIWALAVRAEHEAAAFIPTGSLSDSELVDPSSSMAPGARAVVELRAVAGGLRPRGLLGGEFAPRPGTEIMFRLGHSGALGLGAPATCPSVIGGQALVAGLPVEFAQAALDGLVRVQCAAALPAGVLSIDRGGYDEVESSQMVFERASGLLRCVLTALVVGEEPNEAELRNLIRD